MMLNAQATRIWFVLMALTLMGFSLAQYGYNGQVLVTVVLVSAFIKGQMIIDYFMALRKVRLLWRLIVSLWLLTILTVIGSLYAAFG